MPQEAQMSSEEDAAHLQVVMRETQGCAGGGGSSGKPPHIFSKQAWALQAQENGDNEKS